MVRHNHVPIDAKMEAAPDSLKCQFEDPTAGVSEKRNASVITTESDEVGLSRLMESPQIPRHAEEYRGKMPHSSPTAGLEWATRQQLSVANEWGSFKSGHSFLYKDGQPEGR